MILKILTVLFTGSLILTACAALAEQPAPAPTVYLPTVAEGPAESDPPSSVPALQFIEFYSPF